MAGRRHHYLPKFVLRRFAARDGARAGLVWRADLSGEQIRQVAPKYEAARNHYYALPPELGLPAGYAEDVLMRVESAAATAILKFEKRGGLDMDDRTWLALFIALQHKRTPRGRQELRFIDEFMARQQAEITLSDTETIRQALASDGMGHSDEDVAAWQEARLAELESGELVIESTPEREVALMFVQLESIVPRLVEDFDWRFLRIPATIPAVVLPDVGMTIYDPAPKIPEGGTGFASSPTAETVILLDPHLALMLRPGVGFGDVRDATSEQVEHLNRRAIASSDRCIYGSSRDAVVAALELAAAEPDRIAALRPRPPTIWIAEMTGEPTPGPTTFVGHSRAGKVTRELNVSQEGIDEAQTQSIRVGRDEEPSS